MAETVDKRDQTIQGLIESNAELRARCRELEAEVFKRATAEQAARAAQQQLRSIAESSPDFILLVALDGTIEFLNKALPGETVEQHVGRRIDVVVGPQEGAKIAACLHRVRESRRPDRYEVEYPLTKGRMGHFEGSVAPVLVHDEVAAFAISVRDVTHLRESEQQLRTLVDYAPEAIVIIDADSECFVDCNPNALALFGMSREALLSIQRSEVSPLRQPDGRLSRESAADWIRRALDGETPAFEWLYKNSFGTSIPCEVRLVRLPHAERRLVRGSITQIAQRKQAEAEREALIRKLEEKNAELERFTYTVSHDLKSPLVTIKGFAGMLAQDLAAGNDASVREDLEEISRAADRMREMLDELLHLSRIGRIVDPKVRLPFQSIAREAVDNLSHLISQRKVDVTVCDDAPDVVGERVRLIEVVQNLVDNSIKFCRADRPAIEIGWRREGDQAVYYVRDNGDGIEPEYHQRVFGLFERLNVEQEGSGVGLAIVKRIVELHGGRVWVESRGLGDGATFCFTLPVTDERFDQDQASSD